MACRRLGDVPNMPTEPTAHSILALHGFTGLGVDFAPFACLCGGNWHCPNLPGHGPDPQPDCSPDASLRFIQSQVSTLNPQPSVLLGYSMGARVALLHAVRHPEEWDALILISPNPGIEDESERAARRAVDEKLAQRIEEGGLEPFITFWQSTPMIRSQQKIPAEWRQDMKVNRSQHTAKGLAASLRQFGQGSCPNLWPNLADLDIPVLLVTGIEDTKYTRVAQRMVAISTLNSKASTHIVVEGAGHMPHLEKPSEVSERIIVFLDSI